MATNSGSERNPFERVADEFVDRLRHGDVPDVEEYAEKYPKLAEQIRELFPVIQEMELEKTSNFQPRNDEAPGNQVEAIEASSEGVRIGRFVTLGVIGEGAFGKVYRAHDPEIDRSVALKVPHQKWFERGFCVDDLLQEARAAGSLKHPGLVAVYDIKSDGSQPYIVQEYIDGRNLGEWIQLRDRSIKKIIQIVKEIASAIGFAHRNGLYHRDLKPANILIDKSDNAHIVDFGLAIHASRLMKNEGGMAGTPAYMSPEQIRCEAHRIDGRTDVWSTGVIMYELLVGRRPFAGSTREELFNEIKRREPQPPRQINPSVPSELERICLKCLGKRLRERYASMADLVADLDAWLESEGSTVANSSSVRRNTDTTVLLDGAPLSDSNNESHAPVVVPKGLRSFDRYDSDFFLQLLPGPRDRHGLPESIRFWKSRIEGTHATESFQVGLIYGPSGCGKSSLVKAGLLPRLSQRVLPIYVEATPDSTELRLQKSIARRIPDLPNVDTLPELFQLLREGRKSNDKVLVVIDQFEQWLHAHPIYEDAN